MSRKEVAGRPYALEVTDAHSESVLMIDILTRSYRKKVWTCPDWQWALIRSIFVDCAVDCRVGARAEVNIRWIYSHSSGCIQNGPAADFTYEQKS